MFSSQLDNAFVLQFQCVERLFYRFFSPNEDDCRFSLLVAIHVTAAADAMMESLPFSYQFIQVFRDQKSAIPYNSFVFQNGPQAFFVHLFIHFALHLIQQFHRVVMSFLQVFRDDEVFVQLDPQIFQ